MASFSRQLLTASTNGRPIKITTVATPGTLVHTSIAGIAGMDEVYLWATNTDSVARDVTVEFGGTTNPDDRIVNTIKLPANSPPLPIVTGQCLQNGLVVRVFASLANVIVITGHVNRID